MIKYSELMIGDWVLVDGTPRSLLNNTGRGFVFPFISTIFALSYCYVILRVF